MVEPLHREVPSERAEMLAEGVGLDRVPDRQAAAVLVAARDQEGERLRVHLDVVPDRRVARGAVFGREQDRRRDAALVLERPPVETTVLEDQRRRAVVRLLLEALLHVAEERVLVVENEGVFVPRDQLVRGLVGLGEVRALLALGEVDEDRLLAVEERSQDLPPTRRPPRLRRFRQVGNRDDLLDPEHTLELPERGREDVDDAGVAESALDESRELSSARELSREIVGQATSRERPCCGGSPGMRRPPPAESVSGRRARGRPRSSVAPRAALLFFVNPARRSNFLKSRL